VGEKRWDPYRGHFGYFLGLPPERGTCLALSSLGIFDHLRRANFAAWRFFRRFGIHADFNHQTVSKTCVLYPLTDIRDQWGIRTGPITIHCTVLTESWSESPKKPKDRFASLIAPLHGPSFA
jgi:hypothetical protein